MESSLRVRALLLVCTVSASRARAQDPAQLGAWSCLHDWSSVMAGEREGPPFPAHHAIDEIAHAALLPVGPHRGSVLLWNYEVSTHTTRTFVFDPLVGDCTPDALLELPQPLASNIFCSGHTFLPDGALLVVGGIPEDGGAERVYRFEPRDMLWHDAPPMAVPRFYASPVQLGRRPLVANGGAWTTEGSSTLVIGGPPSSHATAGQPLWETLAAADAAWQALAPSELAECPPLAGHPYQVLPPLACDDVKFDSYPRALLLSSGDLFLAGDVDTAVDLVAYGESPPGRTWFVRPPGVEDSPAWLLTAGPWMTDTGSGESADAHRRLYASAVLLHEHGRRDRVLVFGGASEQPLAFQPETLALFPSAGVEELASELAAPVPTGTWHAKADMTFPRTFANAVVLPTREVLVTGGVATVDLPGIEPPVVFVPVHPPELYDPGDGPDEPGTTRIVAPAPSYPHPNGGAAPIDRLYHHVALLLPDGRVLVAGGEQKGFTATASKHTAEIYSPPYLFQGERPRIDQAPWHAHASTPDAPSTFAITVRAPAADVLDRVVLLRPGSVTHHFDADQRYVELAFEEGSSHLYIEGGATTKVMKVAELRVTAPDAGLAPEGWYLLFVVHRKPTPGHRVPSVARFLRLR